MMYVQTLKQDNSYMRKYFTRTKKSPAHMASESIKQKWKPAGGKKKGRKIPA